jgi:hypothetical protein
MALDKKHSFFVYLFDNNLGKNSGQFRTTFFQPQVWKLFVTLKFLYYYKNTRVKTVEEKLSRKKMRNEKLKKKCNLFKT